MFTVDQSINTAISDQWVKYKTLRFNGVVKGQLVDRNGSAEAICRMLNESLISESRIAETFAL
jgi:hypothetical protein